tara:strand:+ start:37 stop:267 length:231 start_codon:yes stop_codon:yes gene_type:complete
MKIVLILVICSALNGGVCDKGWEKQNMDFPDWDSCMRQGYIDSLQIMDLMGTDYVNANKSFIKFYCREVKAEEMGL